MREAAVFVAQSTSTPLPVVLQMRLREFGQWLDAAVEVRKKTNPFSAT